MDPLDFLEPEDLLRFFHQKKTELSLMENPQTFLNQLRDYNLIPEDRYKKVSRMKSKDNLKKGVYGLLDWLEVQRSKHITTFWTCVFKETILNQYPTLRLLRNSLLDGSFQCEPKLPEKVEKEETDGANEGLSEDKQGEGKQENSVKKKKRRRTRSAGDDEDEEQTASSTQATPRQRKKPQKLCFTSPLKMGEKEDIWTWPIFKVQLPVTCGDQEGFLNRERLAKGEKCIVVGKQWFTPGEFERFSGKENTKNWKLSIRCKGTTLGKLIQDGQLTAGTFHRRTKAKKSLFSDRINTGRTEAEEEDDDDDSEENRDSSSEDLNSTSVTEEEEAEEQTDEQSELDRSNAVFKVTCGDVAATLHKKRFASGTCGKSIRTEKRWMTPVDFVKEVSCQTDVSWRKDIKCEGRPLSDLIHENILRIHSLLCKCKLCMPDLKELENQKNDDECWICKSEGQTQLVECDYCPRSFHQQCHLPHIEDDILQDDRPWMCTFCVSINTKELFLPMEKKAVMSREISDHMLQCQCVLLHLYSIDERQIFATNPCLTLRDYTTVIKTPMWLGRVAEKLEEKKYKNVGEYVSDVQLIFTNCSSYNRDNPEFRAMGVNLQEAFDREFKNVFKIHEEAAES